MVGRPASADAAGRPGSRRPSGRRPDDPRSVRTRTRIRRTLLDAIESAEDPGELSVAEVCRRADVHRVTFYGHWESLDLAIAEAFAEIIDALAAVSADDLSTAASPQDLARAYDEALHVQVAELMRRREIYRRLFLAPGSRAFTAPLESSMQLRAEAAIATLERVGLRVPGHEDGIAAAALAGSVTAAFAVVVASEEDDVAAAAQQIAAQLPRWGPQRID